MASIVESVFSAQWLDYGNDCYIEPIVLFETKRLFRRPQQLSTHALHVDSSLDWLRMEHIVCKGKVCGLALVCNPPFRVQRASFVLRVQRLAVEEVKVRSGVTVNGKNQEADITFRREKQTVVIADLENGEFNPRPLAILNSMSSVLAFGGWDKIPD